MGTRTVDPNVFGPVASISTAPVSIGSTISGSAPVVHAVKDGVRIMGRDFMFQLAAVTSTQTNWVLVGGCPLIPHSFVASTLRAYASMYAEFVVHGMSFHYITSSPTDAIGNVMFYINKDRGNSLLDTSNNNFMSVVLSDPCTVIGPLWKNNSATYTPVFKTYTTNILNDEPLRDEGPGELFIYSKTSASSTLGSPGYVLVDFDITFKTLQTSPRDLTFPIARLKYNQYGLGYPASIGIVAGGDAVMRSNLLLLNGTTSILTNDPAARLGDIYKMVMCPQYGGFSGVTAANLLLYTTRQGAIGNIANTALTIDDGFTCYGIYCESTQGLLILYPTYEAAKAQSYPYVWGVTAAVASWTIPTWLSLVGHIGAITYQSNF